jgi:MFS family permease
MVMSLGFYGGFAIFFVWMGLGSMKGRRWARALMLITSICWLIVGTLTTFFLAFVIPQMISAALVGSGATMTGKAAAGATVAAMAMVVSFIALFMAILPGIFFLFYRSSHVKATCEHMDPKERWTDRVPLAVLALSVLLALGGTYLFLMLAAPAFPLFGFPLRGPLAILAMLVMAVAMWVLAVNVYRRQRWAWTAALVFTLLGYLSTFITFLRMDAAQLMETAGVRSTPGNAQAFAAMVPAMNVMVAVSMVIWLAYLLYVLRYFKGATGAPASESPGRDGEGP